MVVDSMATAQTSEMTDFDVVVVGGGAAGLSAALMLSRARRRVLVVDAGVPRNSPATHMHGFLSRDGMAPAELLAVGRNEVKGYGCEVRTGVVAEVASADPSEFLLVLDGGLRLSARRLLVATGLRDELPEVGGLRDRWGRDVLHCPYCHGYEVREQPVGFLGGPPDAVRYALIVRQWSDDVVFFAPTATLSATERLQLAARAIDVVEGTVKRVLVENDRLCGVALEDGRAVRRQALFVPPRFVPNDSLLVGLGCEIDESGWVRSDVSGRTTVPGVWVAGNVANPRAHVIAAAGEGCAAAIAINADLVDEEVSTAVRTAQNGLLT